MDSVLAQFWTLQDGKWLNRRALSEIDKATSQADTNRRIAFEREAKRSTKRETNRGTKRSTNGEPNHSHSQTLEPKPEPKTSSHKPPVVVEVPPELGTSVQSQTPRWVPAAKKNSRPRATTDVWEAYSKAYVNRYGVEPTRNRKVNAQLKQFCERVPIKEAGLIAHFYLGHNNAYYLRVAHSVGAMLADAEKLRTEWQTGRKVTGQKALQDEQTATNFDNAERAIETLERKDHERAEEKHHKSISGDR